MMFETILAVFIGYVIGRLVSQPSRSLRVPDKILTWDSSLLAYRPVHKTAVAERGKKYLICYEVSSSDTSR